MLTQGTRLRSVLERHRFLVNSMHHQGIKGLAPELVPAATAPDGLIEAVEASTDHFLVGVPWHPEVFAMTDPHTRHPFREFIAAARSCRQRAR